MIYVIIGVVLVLVVLVILMLNGFIKLNNKVNEAFATMDVYLKKRWDLIPSLVETVKGYAKHEQETLEEVIKMRSGDYDLMDNEEKIKTNEKVTRGISRIMALAESYPNLKANENFLELQRELADTETKIQATRQFYNNVVMGLNTAVEQFPTNLIANMFGIKQEKLFEIDESERKAPQVKF